ncbi:MAG: c-type cytochrome, partial [Ilumatobacteraceae bacterium]
MSPLLADVTTTLAWIALVAALGGWALYAFFNIRSSRAEIGSEIELAANRKPYYDDEILEGKKLERTQLLGLVFLAIITVTLPLYWILEPGRQAGAEKDFVHKFETWGSGLFAATAEGGFNCAGCHGGMNGGGGVASYAVTDPKTGEVKAVNWKAPAINNVYLRYSEEEVRFILNYGRPFSPMSAWGLVGGGPMNEQQIQTVLDYLKSIQVPRENCASLDDDAKMCDGGTLAKKNQDEIQAEAERLVAAGTYASLGEALFNLDLGAGSYSCARCHTKGWSYGEPQITGGGAFGPNLTGGSTIRQFPNQDDMIAFISAGSE